MWLGVRIYEIQYSCMWMSSRALLSLCRVWLGERQGRVMMSPSLANKLRLTLWGPWRKGEEMEWEFAVAMLQDNIHGRWEAMVMLGEGSGKDSWNLCKGEGQMTPASVITVKKEENLIQTATLKWDNTPIFSSDPREKTITLRSLASYHHVIFSSRCKTEAWQ